MFSDPHKTHKYSLCGQNVECVLNQMIIIFKGLLHVVTVPRQDADGPNTQHTAGNLSAVGVLGGCTNSTVGSRNA